MVETCGISQQYITKHLEYVTKDHIAMHTIVFKLKTALFLRFLVVKLLLVTNNLKPFICSPNKSIF